jgi:hypothetical protein
VDTPGTCDSGALLEDNLKHISEFLATREGSGGNGVGGDSSGGDGGGGGGGGGLHALVLVLSAAARFTQEEAIAMERQGWRHFSPRCFAVKAPQLTTAGIVLATNL